MANEQFVREHWSEPWLADSHDGKHYGIVLATASLAVWSKDRSGWAEFGTPEQAWSAAAAFTRERLEQIRQVEEEITQVGHALGKEIAQKREDEGAGYDVLASDDEDHVVIWNRILAREQAALAELKKGMR
jgi:hypothetical protein